LTAGTGLNPPWMQSLKRCKVKVDLLSLPAAQRFTLRRRYSAAASRLFCAGPIDIHEKYNLKHYICKYPTHKTDLRIF
jgi:hypothetical protein